MHLLFQFVLSYGIVDTWCLVLSSYLTLPAVFFFFVSMITQKRLIFMTFRKGHLVKALAHGTIN